MDKSEHGKFTIGPLHIFNPVPINRDESLQHENDLAASGNYPIGTSPCFNAWISGGCAPECFIYLDGECKEPQEMVDRLETKEEIDIHKEFYNE